jgi:NAD(P)-dependent dehydrogenase (short-subunit alcohol dehydrogenase family)
MTLTIDSLFSVRGKIALVTGGATGIGRMIASGFAQNGAKVYIASRKRDTCEAAAEEISHGGGSCTALQVDLADMASLEALACEVTRREPKLHILVNNAGAGWAQPIEKYTEKGWDRVMDLNLKAPFFLIRALLPKLRAAATPNDPARIVNIGSVAGSETLLSNNFAYGPSKAALHHLTRTLARNLADDGITVNAIAPGPFPSRMMGDQLDHFADQIPLGRAGEPEDAAGTALYFCSRAGAWTTGVVLPLDGGKLTSGGSARSQEEA